MARTVRLRELLIGIEGLALLRHLYDGTDEDAAQRLAEVRGVLDDPALDGGEETPEADVSTGYTAWADAYDDPGNLVIELEEPVVSDLIAARPPGRALDLACGTGRLTSVLVGHGHEVIAVDLTAAMLRNAVRRLPRVPFGQADVLAVPVHDDQFDLVVCGLALAHVADLEGAIAEIARLLRPGGRAVISVLHPFQALLGWHAPFTAADGRRGFVREHPHTHARYLEAFAAAGLTVTACLEPTMTAASAEHKRRAFRHIPEATVAAYAGLPAVLVWELAELSSRS